MLNYGWTSGGQIEVASASTTFPTLTNISRCSLNTLCIMFLILGARAGANVGANIGVSVSATNDVRVGIGVDTSARV